MAKKKKVMKKKAPKRKVSKKKLPKKKVVKRASVKRKTVRKEKIASEEQIGPEAKRHDDVVMHIPEDKVNERVPSLDEIESEINKVLSGKKTKRSFWKRLFGK